MIPLFWHHKISDLGRCIDKSLRPSPVCPANSLKRKYGHFGPNEISISCLYCLFILSLILHPCKSSLLFLKKKLIFFFFSLVSTPPLISGGRGQRRVFMGAGPHNLTPLNFVLMSDDFKSVSENPSVVRARLFSA